jgi:TPR repeat protein
MLRRVWDGARLGIAVAALIIAGTMLTLRLREEIRRNGTPPSAPSSTPVVSDALRQQCEQRQAGACLDLGLAWLRIGTSQGDREARDAFEQACQRGDVQGCHNLGRMLAEGTGGTRDRSKARDAYVKACDAGLPWSCYAGALILVDEDPGRAATMLQRACNATYAAACYELALLYDAGNGVSHDERKARALLDSACQAGESRACAVAKAVAGPDLSAVTSPRR